MLCICLLSVCLHKMLLAGEQKTCLLRNLCPVKMQSQAVKSIPVSAVPDIFLRKKRLNKREKKTGEFPAQLPTIQSFVQAGVENKIDVRLDAALKTLGECFLISDTILDK